MNTDSAVLDRFLNPVRQCMTRELAQKLVDFRVDVKHQAHIDELARKCNQGLISNAEQAEYEAIIEEVDMIALLQAKARTFLANAE